MTVTAYDGGSDGGGSGDGAVTSAREAAHSESAASPAPAPAPLIAVKFAAEALRHQEEIGATLASDGDIGSACVAAADHVHMDAMAFGMGCCCLQVTFQARDLEESTYLYDQLAIVSPLMVCTRMREGAMEGAVTRYSASGHAPSPSRCASVADGSHCQHARVARPPRRRRHTVGRHLRVGGLPYASGERIIAAAARVDDLVAPCAQRSRRRHAPHLQVTLQLRRLLHLIVTQDAGGVQ